MPDVTKLLRSIESKDIYSIAKGGMSDEIQQELTTLCSFYSSATSVEKARIREEINARTTTILLGFVSRMATLALGGNTPMLDVGLLAVELSNVVQVDMRDAFGPLSQLSYAAKLHKVDLISRAELVIPDIADGIIPVLRNPLTPRTMRDSEGRLMFVNPFKRGLESG